MTENDKIVEKFLNEYQNLIKNFKKWCSTQSHLPQEIPDIMILRLLEVCDYDIEKAKDLLEINVRFRRKNMSLFTNRDPYSKEMQNVMNTVQVTSFPKLTKEGYHITGFRLIDFDTNNFILDDTIKYIFMIQDMLCVKSGMVHGDLCIFDAKGFTIWHFMKMVSSLSVINVFMRYVQEASALKLKQNHYVNCSSVLSKVISFLKPLMKKELSDVMHFHTSGFETLHEFIPKEYLPVEYEGTAGCLDDYYSQTISKLYDESDYLNDDSKFFISNIKKP